MDCLDSGLSPRRAGIARTLVRTLALTCLGATGVWSPRVAPQALLGISSTALRSPRVAPQALLGISSTAFRSPRVAPQALLGISSTALRSQSNTVSGDFWVEPPTLRSLGFEWRIAGDDNRNASVAVSYRKKGEQQWRKALPLFRLQHESVTGIVPRDGSGEHFNHYIAPNMFAGSILNLEPDTEYDCRLVLADPDGVKGKQEQLVHVRTRKEPTPAPGGAVYHVYPFGYKGAKEEPAFTGLLAAYYLGADESDHSREMPARVKPGDTILVHAGLYKDNREPPRVPRRAPGLSQAAMARPAFCRWYSCSNCAGGRYPIGSSS
ncbi:MAG TPA: hypothetical protein VI653_04505, partial [Steroidobacteraceae bacterium]